MKYVIHYHWMGGKVHSFTSTLNPERVPAMIAELLCNYPDAWIEIEPIVVDVPPAFAECIQSLDIAP